MKRCYSIDDIKRAAINDALWFSESTMRFFNSRVDNVVFNVNDATIPPFNGFISSEVPPGQSRRYTVRRLREDGRIVSVSGLCEFTTLKAAYKAARKFLNEHAQRYRVEPAEPV